LNIEQVQRFYDTLAMLIGQREGVEITVKVTPRKEGQRGREQDGEAYNSLPQHQAVRVS
jgi:hypothetical protein